MLSILTMMCQIFWLKKKNDKDSSEESDEYASNEIDYVEFVTAGEDNVIIPNVTTTNPFLNKLYVQ